MIPLPLASLVIPKWLTDLIGPIADPADVQKMLAAQRQANEENVRIVVRARIVAEAMNEVGSQRWALGAFRDFEGKDGTETYTIGNNKCNLFVYEMLLRSGVQVPLREREDAIGIDYSFPPLAGDWANPAFQIPGFEVLKVPPDVPQPGDVVAVANVSWGATGHVGIVADSKNTVSGRYSGVVKNEWGFRKENEGKAVFRRYVGPPTK